MSAPFVVIVGPTAIGKTRLSVELAKALNATVISGDAFQLYRTLDIATAKATPEEQSAVTHKLIDVIDPNDTISAAEYQKMVRTEIDSLRQQNDPVILVGGSGLYVQSVLFDYRFPGNSRSDAFEQKYALFSNAELKEHLRRIDHDRADAIHESNRRRLLRAIQIASSDDSSEQTRQSPIYEDAILIGLKTERDILYEHIERRVDQMIERGLVEEARRVHERYRTSQASAAIGYKELFPYFDGEQTLAECIETIKLHSRRYAKRQMTWFQNQMDVVWFDVNFADFSKTVDEVKQYVSSKK
jgi:tRNA dimethylallyltransferase